MDRHLHTPRAVAAGLLANALVAGFLIGFAVSKGCPAHWQLSGCLHNPARSVCCLDSMAPVTYHTRKICSHLQVAGSVMGLRAHGPLLGPSAAEDAAARRDRAAAAAEDRAMQQRMAAAAAAGFQGQRLWPWLAMERCWNGHCMLLFM